jgi:hypothetical protein
MKKELLWPTAVLVALLLLVASWLGYRSQQRLNQRLLAEKEEFLSLQARYAEQEAAVKALLRRARLRETSSISQAAEALLESLGLREKLQSIKPLSRQTLDAQLVAEEASLRLTGLDLNEVVNVLYGIRKSPSLLVLKRLKLRRQFQGPALEMTLQLALVSPKK